MRINVSAYIPGTSCIHACDAHVKIVLHLAYSIALFFVDTWAGLALCALAFAAALVASRLSAGRVFILMIPLYVIVVVTMLFNGFTFDVAQAEAGVSAVRDGVQGGVFAQMAPIALVGSFGVVPAGLERGAFFAVRMVLLVGASLIVSFSTTSTNLISAFNSFLRPLRAIHVPTDDIATVLSLALRFIPLTAEELGRVHDAQWARGASFGEGSFWKRLRAWQTVMIPLFVGLFRRADTLAAAMDARCYGTPGVTRTSRVQYPFTPKAAIILLTGLITCTTVGVFL